MATRTSLRDYQRDLAARLQSADSGHAATKLGLQVGGARFRTGGALLVERSLGLRNPDELQPQAASGPQPAWLKAEYSDAEGTRWKELDVAQLVADAEFLAVGA